jgi:rhomboid protease GluP
MAEPDAGVDVDGDPADVRVLRRDADAPVRAELDKSAGIFVLYNVVYGSVTRTTDLSAHFGGLVTGFVVGMLLIRPRSMDYA